MPVLVTSRSGIKILRKEVDLLRHSSEDDVLKDQVWYPILELLSRGNWDYLIAASPCGDFSRAKWSDKLGPRPKRRNPRGFLGYEESPRKLQSIQISWRIVLRRHQAGNAKWCKDASAS